MVTAATRLADDLATIYDQVEAMRYEATGTQHASLATALHGACLCLADALRHALALVGGDELGQHHPQ